jgi:poly-gamma-glutamate capsule biosynthesis protein CapA/YwtB (metallophosphatase superfamily)
MISRTIRHVSFVPSKVLVLALAAFAAAPPLASGQDPNISVALVGQALIKSDVCATAPAAFEQARGYLKGVDVAFTNLEVAIIPAGEKLTPRGPAAVPAPPVVIDCLKSMGFNILSLANNHAFDLQREGIAVTIGEVRKRGLVHAGTGADADAAAAAGVLDTAKGKVALVAMATGAQLVDPETWAAPGRPGVNYLERLPDGRPNPQHKNRILDAVRAATRDSKLVIAYHHNHYWGDPVGSGLPPDREKRIERFETLPWAVDWARELIDAGASIYVAHGDPSLHGVEVYKGKLILHGLGNYIFESVGGNDRYGPLAYMSAVATAEFSNGQLVAAKFRPLILSTVKVGEAPRGVPYLAEGAEAELILHRLVDQSRRHGVTLEVDTATQTAHWRRRR